MAIQAALTGHLVLSTLHTNDAISSITRLIDLGIPAHMITASLRGMMAQRLVRRLCGDFCKEKTPVLKETWQELVGQASPSPRPLQLFAGGLPRMQSSPGMLGLRLWGVYEKSILMDRSLKDIIRKKRDARGDRGRGRGQVRPAAGQRRPEDRGGRDEHRRGAAGCFLGAGLGPCGPSGPLAARGAFRRFTACGTWFRALGADSCFGWYLGAAPFSLVSLSVVRSGTFLPVLADFRFVFRRTSQSSAPGFPPWDKKIFSILLDAHSSQRALNSLNVNRRSQNIAHYKLVTACGTDFLCFHEDTPF